MPNKILNKKELNKAIDASLKRSNLIEKICRKICTEQGINSERLVCKMMPELLNYPFMGGYYLPNPQFTMPAWMMYIDLVKLTLEVIEK